jgi:hypothetical protein
MFASIIKNNYLNYPDYTNFFSPHEKYPEYPFGHISSEPNYIYYGIRKLFYQAGLDIKNFGSRSWNPLGLYIKRGDSVFILPNFVFHKNETEDDDKFFSKCTHASVLRVIIDYVIIANGGEGKIAIGNAPLQSCDFQKIIKDSNLDKVLEFYKSNKIDISAVDLRDYYIIKTNIGTVTSNIQKKTKDSVSINLGEFSQLNKLYVINDKKKIRFRVSDYNPDRTESAHSLHYHNYFINKKILESDVIISVPKLKTHEKVGITCAIKGYVGIVSNKDCLAHHRFGFPKINGDEYPDRSMSLLFSSIIHDFVQRRKYPEFMAPLFDILDTNYRRFLRRGLKKILAGAWYGNDTAWRMALDLANIAHFCDKSGKLCNSLKRQNLVLIDGVIAGEGNGPLKPRPVKAKCLIFSDNAVLADLIACKIMGWPEEKIPLIKNAIKEERLFRQLDNSFIYFNREKVDLTSLKPALGRKFIPPDGWIDIILK